MENITVGAGYAALGFWIFLAAIVAAGIWDSIRKRDAQHETLRRLIESGQTIDEQLTGQLLEVLGGNKDKVRDLRTAAFIMLALAPGMVALGWGLSFIAGSKILVVLTSVAALMLCLGLGMLWTSHHLKEDDEVQGLR